ncbi:hypothetical protein C1H46_019928 [Malus baccata]|uniref:Uncharacterized protein n=1 Tax=Malus baccata TaxID=106549 RepID=A0A540M6Y0_MALBA|nr:hypothetical protein C1H46_019928 [Malus baccata]
MPVQGAVRHFGAVQKLWCKRAEVARLRGMQVQTGLSSGSNSDGCGKKQGAGAGRQVLMRCRCKLSDFCRDSNGCCASRRRTRSKCSLGLGFVKQWCRGDSVVAA